MRGVEGIAVYIDDRRVAGPKPWGGGTTIHSFKARRDDILEALGLKRRDAPTSSVQRSDDAAAHADANSEAKS